MLTIQGKKISVFADTAGLRYTVRMACGMDWTMTDRPYIETGRRGRLYFEEAALVSETLIDTGVCHGVEALYDFGEGVTVTTRVTLQKAAPMGDPIEIRIRGYELTLRLEDAKNITVGEPETERGAKA